MHGCSVLYIYCTHVRSVLCDMRVLVECTTEAPLDMGVFSL